MFTTSDSLYLLRFQQPTLSCLLLPLVNGIYACLQLEQLIQQST